MAARLKAPLDVFLVRKLGVPGHPELAMGAIAEGGIEVLSADLIRDLGIPRALVEQVASRERLELERRDSLFRGGRRPASVGGRTVILVDDGLATGATMEAAIMALREQQPARIVVAAPVGARETCDRLARLADKVVCAVDAGAIPAVGLWYDDFARPPTTRCAGCWQPPPIALPRHRGSAPARTEARSGRRGARDVRSRSTGDAHDYDALLDGIGDARVVLIGEATHGTHEFYRHRALITGRLIREKGFRAVAVEADWPDAYRVNRYVRGDGRDQEAIDALADFRRFPDVDVAQRRRARLRRLAAQLQRPPPGGRSRRLLRPRPLQPARVEPKRCCRYLHKVDPDAAARARTRYACFDRFGEELQAYAYAAGFGLTPSCEQEVVSELIELHRRAADYAKRDGRIAADEYFVAEQNARVVRNAEEYYRTMLRGRVQSWNLRDRHMADTLRELRKFLGRTQPGARVVVWAHNSHLGDARATEMGRARRAQRRPARARGVRRRGRPHRVDDPYAVR